MECAPSISHYRFEFIRSRHPSEEQPRSTPHFQGLIPLPPPHLFIHGETTAQGISTAFLNWNDLFWGLGPARHVHCALVFEIGTSVCCIITQELRMSSEEARLKMFFLCIDLQCIVKRLFLL
jgi:hypothetical protein